MRTAPFRASLLALVLPGCLAPHPDEARPELQALMRGEVRDGWAEDAAQGNYDRTAFWLSFEDPVLNDLVLEALQYNHDLVASAERMRASAARAMISRSARRPQVNARLDGTRQQQVFVGLPVGGDGTIKNTFNQFNAAVDLSWELDLWGKLAAGVEGFDAELQATYADLQAARLSIAAQVTIAWFALREATEQVALAEATVETFESSLQVVQDRYDAGLSGALDLRLSQANVAGSEADLVGAIQNRDFAARQIEILLGRFPSAELEAAGEFVALPPEVPAGLPVEILSRRPDIVAIERRVASAEAFAREDRLDRWPTLALTASGGRTSQLFEDLLNGDFTVWSLAGQIAAPLIDGGRRRAQIKESLAQLREARAAFAAAALRAFFEVENALDAEQRLQESIEFLERAAVLSREATELAQDQYREGLVSIELVLESQRRQLIAEASFLTARRNLFQNRVDLHVALGGSFDAAPALAADELVRLEEADPYQPDALLQPMAPGDGVESPEEDSEENSEQPAEEPE
ncbi:MAG: efflux transporter outer membrane subunit [Planctomycetota bacterium]